ncbi:Sec-independent protein translocase subunit TatA [uncultured Corynebacterium sp.]|uniref:Sec-independent protein translocase subunit TatA n=1 Tax=uncultured Corynebacterium sp. TaxID=159447 RepID=UPI0037DC5319
MPGVWEWVIIAVVVIIFFGANKLPDAARSLGRSMRIFKSEVKELNKENNTETPTTPDTTTDTPKKDQA